MPLFHTAQLNAFVTPAIAVGAAIFIEKGFDAVRLLDLIETERLTLTFALPMMYRAMLEQMDIRARDVSSLRLAVYAMAPMPTHELKAAIETLRLRVLADVRTDGNEPARSLFPPRTSTEPRRRGRHAGAERAGGDHGRQTVSYCHRDNPARSSTAARR